MNSHFIKPSSTVRGAARTLALRAVSVGTALLTLAACQDTPTSTESAVLIAPDQPALAVARPGDPAGYLEICKIAGLNVQNGESYQFALSGPNVAPGLTTTVLAGGCSAPIAANAGDVTVTELAQPGITVDQITFVGAGAPLSSSVLATRTATVRVVAGGVENVTIANFRNRRGFGFIKVCKVGATVGNQTTLGQTFGFTATGTGVNAAWSLVAAAGTEASSNCAIIGGSLEPQLIPAGTVVSITEGPSATSVLDGVLYQGLGSNVTTGRTAAVTVGSGENVVTFRNVPPAPLYPLQICKTYTGATAPPGTTFPISAGGTVYNVAPGTCVNDGQYAAGTQVVVQEVAFPVVPGINFALINVAASGAATLAGAPNLITRTATVVIGAGPNTVTFANTGTAFALPGAIRVCKVGGAGIMAGMPFPFSYTVNAGAPMPIGPVPAGSVATPGCVTSGPIPAGATVVVTEGAVPNTTLTSIVGGTVDLANRRTTVTILDATTTTVTFTNIATGNLQLCKVAGNTGAIGQAFNFTSSVTGATVTTVTATTAGNCVPLGGPLAVGSTATVTEQARPGYIVFGNVYTQSRVITAGLNTITFRNFAAQNLCTLTQGYWKNHGPNANGNQEDAITATLAFGRLTGSPYVTASGELRLIIGANSYSAAQLEEILRTPVRGDQNIALMHQLIAAQLNVIAIGTAATPANVLTAINSRTNADLLAMFNEGLVGPGHCD